MQEQAGSSRACWEGTAMKSPVSASWFSRDEAAAPKGSPAETGELTRQSHQKLLTPWKWHATPDPIRAVHREQQPKETVTGRTLHPAQMRHLPRCPRELTHRAPLPLGCPLRTFQRRGEGETRHRQTHTHTPLHPHRSLITWVGFKGQLRPFRPFIMVKTHVQN